MAKEELITFEGLVTELLPDARFRVQLDTGHSIIAYTAGTDEEAPDQDAGRRPGDGRDVAIRSGKRPAGVPSQGRARRGRAAAAPRRQFRRR